MLLNIEHITRYVYPTPASESHSELRLMPRSDADQSCTAFDIRMRPEAPIFWYDTLSGRVHHFNVRPPHSEMEIVMHAQCETHRTAAFDGLQLVSSDFDYYANPEVRSAFAEFLMPTGRVPLVPDLDRIVRLAERDVGKGAASFLITVTRLLHRVVSYRPGATDVNSTVREVLARGAGVCQDFAHLMLGIARRRGIPARYVSGYLYTPPSANEASRQMSSAMHAWVECLCPDGRWHGFDPANGLLIDDNYVTVHTGRDYADVPPVRGIYRGPFAHNSKADVRILREDDIEAH